MIHLCMFWPTDIFNISVHHSNVFTAVKSNGKLNLRQEQLLWMHLTAQTKLNHYEHHHSFEQQHLVACNMTVFFSANIIVYSFLSSSGASWASWREGRERWCWPHGKRHICFLYALLLMVWWTLTTLHFFSAGPTWSPWSQRSSGS